MFPNLVNLCKNALGSYLGAQWEAPGAQNASTSKKNIKLDILPPRPGMIFGSFSKNSGKNYQLFRSFLKPSI